jgi:hypothetical protein
MQDIGLKEPLKTGDQIEVEVCPGEGQYKAETVDGTPFTERFTPEAMQAIVDNWEGEGEEVVVEEGVVGEGEVLPERFFRGALGGVRK